MTRILGELTPNQNSGTTGSRDYDSRLPSPLAPASRLDRSLVVRSPHTRPRSAMFTRLVPPGTVGSICPLASASAALSRNCHAASLRLRLPCSRRHFIMVEPGPYYRPLQSPVEVSLGLLFPAANPAGWSLPYRACSRFSQDSRHLIASGCHPRSCAAAHASDPASPSAALYCSLRFCSHRQLTRL